MHRDDLERLLIEHSMPDAHWGGGRHSVLSDLEGVSEWRLTGTLLDGGRLDVFGCDFLTVRGDEIVSKRAFRKQRPVITDPPAT